MPITVFPNTFVAGGETILDTYTLPGGGQIWRSANNWWNNIHGGTWSSTGLQLGDYVDMDNSSYIAIARIRLGPDLATIPAGCKCRITFTPGDAQDAITYGATVGGDSTFYWDAGNPTVAEIEAGGTWGWDGTDDLKVELYTV